MLCKGREKIESNGETHLSRCGVITCINSHLNVTVVAVIAAADLLRCVRVSYLLQDSDDYAIIRFYKRAVGKPEISGFSGFFLSLPACLCLLPSLVGELMGDSFFPAIPSSTPSRSPYHNTQRTPTRGPSFEAGVTSPTGNRRTQSKFFTAFFVEPEAS